MTNLIWRLLPVLVLLGACLVAEPVAARQATPVPTSESIAMYRGGPARTGEVPGPGPDGAPELRWSSWLGFLIASSPAVVDGVVYVGTVSPVSVAGGAVHAVDAATGEELWQAATIPGDGFFSAPAVVDGTVYIGSYNGFVLAVSATDGAERWRFQAEASVYGSPAVVDGAVYIGDDAGHLYALDATSGEQRWRFAVDRSYERGISTSAAVVDGTVYVIVATRRESETSWLYALDAATGEQHWRFAAPDGGMLRGTPAVAGGRVYAVTLAGALFAVDASVGRELWRVPAETRDAAISWENPSVAGDTVFYVPALGTLAAVDAASGEAKWAMDLTGGTPLISSPAIAGGVVFLGDAQGVLHAVDAATGRERWQVPAGSFLASPAVIAGVIYVGGEDGLLRSFGAPARREAAAGRPTPQPPGTDG